MKPFPNYYKAKYVKENTHALNLKPVKNYALCAAHI